LPPRSGSARSATMQAVTGEPRFKSIKTLLKVHARAEHPK
jgi:hypothetical protein